MQNTLQTIKVIKKSTFKITIEIAAKIKISCTKVSFPLNKIIEIDLTTCVPSANIMSRKGRVGLVHLMARTLVNSVTRA